MTSSPPARPTRRAEVRLALIGIGLLGLAGLVVLWRFDPAQTDWFPSCLLRRWLGIHCPGCGTTRALHAMLRGDLVTALRFNPLLVIGAPLAVAAWAIGRGRRRHGEPISRRASPRLALAALVVVTAYFLARNLPSPSRGWLAPPASTAAPEGQGGPATGTP